MSAAPIVEILLDLCATVSVEGGNFVARRTVLVCDNCGKEVGENKGAAMRITFTDARRGSKVADLCDPCAGEHARAAPPLVAGAGRSPSPC